MTSEALPFVCMLADISQVGRIEGYAVLSILCRTYTGAQCQGCCCRFVSRLQRDKDFLANAGL